MKSTIISLTIVATLASTTIAFAQPRGSGCGFARGAGPAERFKTLDTNNDGSVTLPELRTNRLKRFDAADTNNDGVLTREEARTARQNGAGERWTQRFESDDANEDGRLTREEAQLPEWLFARLDTNGDGYVTRAEALAAPRGRGKGPGKAQGKANGHRSRPMPGDSNGDGKLSRSEASTAVGKRFAQLDLDKNGKVSLAEFEKVGPPKHRRGGRSGAGRGGKAR